MDDDQYASSSQNGVMDRSPESPRRSSPSKAPKDSASRRRKRPGAQRNAPIAIEPERQVSTATEIAARSVFDETWYRARAGDLGGTAPYEHYITAGASLGLSPSPLFDPGFYAQGYPEIDFSDRNPLCHYFETPLEARRDPHPLFDREFYSGSGAAVPADADPLLHYLAGGEARARSPHPLFDGEFYLSENPDIAAGGDLPLRHFLVSGWKESGRNPHPLFDVDWYYRNCPDERNNCNYLLHYLSVGIEEGWSPNPLFDPVWYVSQTSDSAAKLNPLRHYIEHGSIARISPHPLFEPGWYRRTYMDAADPIQEPLAHFLRYAGPGHPDPNPLFSSEWYLQRYPDIAADGWIPVLHYLRHGGAELRDPHPAFSAMTYVNQHPDCGALGVSPLVHALGKDRPGSGRPVVFAGGGPGAEPIQARTAKPQSLDARAQIPSHRRRLAEFLTAVTDEHAMLRTLNYFSIIEHLDLNGSTSTLSRQERLDLLVEHLRTLSEKAAEDGRPIEASIIIPAYNHIEYTLAAAISLFDHRCSTKFEVVIGNNVSDDETRDVFESIGGALFCITHELNEGFIRNCNLSVPHANGKHIVLLNNDTIILDNWLDELLAPFERFDCIGLVGSKLLMADGSLQEAGGIIWRDASGWNYGRGQDPMLPEFSYLKNVDYVSGASIAVPKALWERIGGFDERYLPAYYDDSDLAFEVRSHGFRTLLAPASMLIHHEGITHGTDTSTGIKAYQVENQRKFSQKWTETLESEQFEEGTSVFFARDRSFNRPHLLMVDHYIPQFDRDTGSRGIFEYCKIFVTAGFHVTFWPDNLFFDKPYAKALQDIGVEVLYGGHLVGQFPTWIAEHGRCFQYAFLSRAHISQNYIDDIRANSDAKILFYGHDLNQIRLRREYDITRNEALLGEITYWETIERAVWEKCDVIYYPAEDELEVVRSQVNKETRLISVVLYPDAELAAARGRVENDFSGTPSIIFVGGFRHRPNVDGALWLVHEIVPLVKQRFPQLVTMIVGSFPPEEITRLGRDDVVVTGYVSDPLLRRLYLSSTVVVAPLRFGAGVKGKIIEALRFGVPTVTTTMGVQGMDDPDRYLAIGDAAEEFAAKVIELIENQNLRRDRILAGVDYVMNEYSYSSFVRRMARDIPELDPSAHEQSELLRRAVGEEAGTNVTRRRHSRNRRAQATPPTPVHGG
jgi:GT2 family glycosyltransferase